MTEEQCKILELEARVAEMREACEAAALRGISHPSDRDTIKANIRALPYPSPDRFMRLLEAARKAKKSLGASSHTAVKILGDALAAFPQPEEQP